MEIKTTNEIKKSWCAVDSVKHHEIFNNIKWVRVDDIIKYLNQYKIDVDDYHSADYFVKKFIDELSQSSPDVTKGDEVSSRDNSKQKSCVSCSGRDISNNKGD